MIYYINRYTYKDINKLLNKNDYIKNVDTGRFKEFKRSEKISDKLEVGKNIDIDGLDVEIVKTGASDEGVVYYTNHVVEIKSIDCKDIIPLKERAIEGYYAEIERLENEIIFKRDRENMINGLYGDNTIITKQEVVNGKPTTFLLESYTHEEKSLLNKIKKWFKSI